MPGGIVLRRTSSGIRRTGAGENQTVCFWTLPDLMHWVHTVILLAPWDESTRTLCRLGSQTRLVLFIA